MITICFNIPTIEQVEFSIECLPEDTQVQGNAMFSGDNEADREAEENIIQKLDNGNEWAWCTVRVVARHKGIEGDDYLGCCSYDSEKDFIENSGYYQDMKSIAYEELISRLKEMAD